jgi:hypothetical protein
MSLLNPVLLLQSCKLMLVEPLPEVLEVELLGVIVLSVDCWHALINRIAPIKVINKLRIGYKLFMEA